MCVNVHLAFDVSWADPPENLHYTTDQEKGIILKWSPPQYESQDLQYQVRLFSSEQSDWKVLLSCSYTVETVIGKLMIFLYVCDILSVLSFMLLY